MIQRGKVYGERSRGNEWLKVLAGLAHDNQHAARRNVHSSKQLDYGASRIGLRTATQHSTDVVNTVHNKCHAGTRAGGSMHRVHQRAFIGCEYRPLLSNEG